MAKKIGQKKCSKTYRNIGNYERERRHRLALSLRASAAGEDLVVHQGEVRHCTITGRSYILADHFSFKDRARLK